jgi:hypothetical protein
LEREHDILERQKTTNLESPIYPFLLGGRLGYMNNRKEPERIMERRIMELQILLAHSISEKELLELAAKLEEANDVKKLLG